MNLHGLDIFLWHDGIPAIPDRIGKFKLTFISSRGTRVYPPPAPDVELSDWPQCRYLSDSEVTDAEVGAVIDELSAKGWRWTMCQKLYKQDGTSLFSEPY